jgi:RND family efflux transporter MFP subunit
MKRIPKKWIIVITIGALTIGGGTAVRQKVATQKTASAVTTAKAERQDFVKSISSSGKTAADKSVELKFQTSGKLSWVGVKEGDTVAAYQAIATLDKREVQKNLEKALRDYSKDRNDFEETWRVTYDGKKTTDTLTDTVKRILEKNQWDLELAVLDVELKNLAVEYATLVTPIAGVVTHIDTPYAGINITPATSVFEVSDPTSIIFEANIDEVDINGIALGQMAKISLDAYPDATFSGVISYIALTSELSSGGSTVFPVKITFDNPEDLRIGLNGDVAIELSREEAALTVPLEAIREDKDGTYVYKKDGNSYVRQPVTTGVRGETEVVVTDGLQEDDTVVTKGFTSIPGAK